MRTLEPLLARLRQAEPAVLAQVVRVQGSTPRDAGTWMAVFANDQLGTIGGGQLEHSVLARARQLLRAGGPPEQSRYALGPSLGQCCGGAMEVRLEPIGVADQARLAQALVEPAWPLALFGAGHVGLALVQLLAHLPFEVLWLDSRDAVFPVGLPPQVRCEHSDPVQAAVDSLVPQSRVLVMSFSHAEDLEIVAACLRRQRARQDLPYIGLIGSQTKWASFRQRLRARGFADAELDQVTCPIGVPGIRDKRPEVIAVAVLAQVLQASA